MRSTSVSPSATRPAITSDAEARRSVAITVAPDSCGTPCDDRRAAVDLDLRAQAHQLVDVHEAVLEDGLDDLRGAVGDAVHRHELRLHVGRETPGTRWCGCSPRCGRPSALHAHASRRPLDRAPASRSLSITASSMVGVGAAQQHVAAGRRHRAQEGAGLDAVGDDAVRLARRVQRARRPGCGCGWCRRPRSARPSRSAARPGRRPRAPARRFPAPFRPRPARRPSAGSRCR